jgi:multiple sugar transport system permease protein
MYITYSNLNMLETYLPLIFPTFLGFGLKGGLFVFLFRQYFIRIPKSLDEAASIDGCGPLRVFFRIALPSSGATAIVCIVLSIVWHWNDFYEPGIYISSFDDMLLPQILGSLYHLLNKLSVDPNMEVAAEGAKIMYHKGIVMAGTVMAILPPFIAYLFLQKRFIEGVERTGLVE